VKSLEPVRNSFSRSYCTHCDQLLAWYYRQSVRPSVCLCVTLCLWLTIHPTAKVS